MTPAEIGAIANWLTVIAIASVIQTLALVGLCIGVLVTARRLDRRIDTLQRDVIAPTAARAEAVMHKVEALVDRVHTIDERVSGTLSRAGSTAGLAAAVVGRKFWPVFGLVQAARAGLSAIGRRRAESARPGPLDRVAPGPMATPRAATAATTAARAGEERPREPRTNSYPTEGGTTHAGTV